MNVCVAGPMDAQDNQIINPDPYGNVYVWHYKGCLLPLFGKNLALNASMFDTASWLLIVVSLLDTLAPAHAHDGLCLILLHMKCPLLT